MRTGMLWLDNQPASTLEFKVERAVNYYQRRYGQLPNLCFVHPSLLEQACGESLNSMGDLGVEVLPSQQVEPDQLWLGFKELIKAAQPSS